MRKNISLRSARSGLAAALTLLVSAFFLLGPAGATPVTSGSAVVAQLSPDKALTAGRPNTTGEATAPPGVLAQAYNWLLTQQQRLNRELAQAVKKLKESPSVSTLLVLGFLSFGYGVLHAAGPGHGKAIISSYVLANHETLRRGVMLSFLSAFIQALSAIALVGVLAIVLNATSLQMRVAEGWIETISWAFVAAVGAWLLFTQIRRIMHRRSVTAPVKTHTHARTQPAHQTAQSHAHNHTHAPEAERDRGDDRGHSHAHSHEHDECCGHAHMPDPKDLGGHLTWTKALAIAFSVGIRPCTSAILVLVFALSQGVLWAGIYSTFAIALGTAVTVAVLAATAVGSRELATRVGGAGSGWAVAVSNGVGLLGASLVLLMGTVFFFTSLQPAAPF
jgi:nickel/cobalt exporter